MIYNYTLRPRLFSFDICTSTRHSEGTRSAFIWMNGANKKGLVVAKVSDAVGSSWSPCWDGPRDSCFTLTRQEICLAPLESASTKYDSLTLSVNLVRPTLTCVVISHNLLCFPASIVAYNNPFPRHPPLNCQEGWLSLWMWNTAVLLLMCTHYYWQSHT